MKHRSRIITYKVIEEAYEALNKLGNERTYISKASNKEAREADVIEVMQAIPNILHWISGFQNSGSSSTGVSRFTRNIEGNIEQNLQVVISHIYDDETWELFGFRHSCSVSENIRSGGHAESYVVSVQDILRGSITYIEERLGEKIAKEFGVI